MMSPNDPTHSASEPHAHHAATVCLSLSEINALCFKAARGAGLHWGEAEEAGWAAPWLSRAGLSGPSIMLAWLDDLAMLTRPVPAPGHWPSHGRAQCPLRTGIALADSASLPEGPGTTPLHIDKLAHPLILLPFAARAAEVLGVALHLDWRTGSARLDPAASGAPLNLRTGDEPGPVDLIIKTAERTPRNSGPDASGGTVRCIAHADWQALDTLALRTTVPPSAQSRGGAGAAGDDNE